jgi:hypothetical protein
MHFLHVTRISVIVFFALTAALEAELWQMADALRGSMDAAEPPLLDFFW